ncbi:hypothetical protein EJB05_04999, partial [Eragrostis curvula]
MAHDCAAAPLLDSLTKAGKPQRNTYSFFCATLASMTTIPMGYSTYATLSRPSQALYPCSHD